MLADLDLLTRTFAARSLRPTSPPSTPPSTARAARMSPARDRIWPRSVNGIESIYWTAKDILTLERHGARTLHGLRTRLACRFLALAAAVALNHRVGLPSRSLVQYTS